MTVSCQNPFALYQEQGDIFSRWSNHDLADKIGGELQHLYDDLTTSSQPDELMDLARLIDERRETGSRQP